MNRTYELKNFFFKSEAKGFDGSSVHIRTINQRSQGLKQTCCLCTSLKSVKGVKLEPNEESVMLNKFQRLLGTFDEVLGFVLCLQIMFCLPSVFDDNDSLVNSANHTQ